MVGLHKIKIIKRDKRIKVEDDAAVVVVGVAALPNIIPKKSLLLLPLDPPPPVSSLYVVPLPPGPLNPGYDVEAVSLLSLRALIYISCSYVEDK